LTLLAPLTAACIAAAAHSYQLPSTYMFAILKAEGGHVGQEVRNTNGTYDLGPFQINSSWGPAIAAYWHITVPQALAHVRDNGCANALIATAILKKYLIESKGDYAKAIGYYHSHTEALASVYRKAVLETVASFGKAGQPMINLPQPKYISPLAAQPHYISPLGPQPHYISPLGPGKEENVTGSAGAVPPR
jgi:hypothetical protein